MIEVQILVPSSDNAGNLFDPAHHALFEAELTARFNGCSLMPGLVAGQWADAGQLYRDQTRSYMVAVPGLLAAAAELNAVISLAKTHYGQLALYVRYLGVSEIL
jgi:hypothetical protein